MKAWEKCILVLCLIFSIACLVAIVKTNYDVEQYYKYQQGIEVDTTVVTPL
jgi:hypothetical protein